MRVVVLNLGVALLAVGPQRGWTVVAGRWLVGLALLTLQLVRRWRQIPGVNVRRA